MSNLSDKVSELIDAVKERSRPELIKETSEKLIAGDKKREGLLFVVDLAYSSMELSTLKFMRGDDRGVEEDMKESRDHLGTEPGYRWRSEWIEGWKGCVNDYNALAEFYRHRQLNVEPIITRYIRQFDWRD